MGVSLHCTRGFTLIEVLAVLLILAILAAGIIPRLQGVAKLANEAQLRAHLREIRHAIERYRTDMGGHPNNLKVLLRDTSPNKSRYPDDGHKVTNVRDDFRGPYIWSPTGELPIDVMTGKPDWVYTKATGTVRSRSRDTGTDGSPYNTY